MRRLMLKGVGVIIFCFILFVFYTIATTRNHSPFDVATFSGKNLNVSMNYCRPYKKGRVIFGSLEEKALQPWGKYWRAGANEASEIAFDQDIVFGGKPVKAGRYRIYAFPEKDRWIIGLNTELEKWGYWEPDYTKDVMNVEVPSENTEKVVEQFTVYFSPAKGDTDSTTMFWEWDNVRVGIPVSAADATAVTSNR